MEYEETDTGKEDVKTTGKVSGENVREALKLFAFVRPYRTRFILALVCIALSSLTILSFPYMLKQLLDSAMPGEQATVEWPTLTIVGVMFGILLIQLIFSYLRVYLFSYVGENALADLRRATYNRLIQLPMSFFSQRRVGELSSRLSADLSLIQDAMTYMLADILRGVLTLAIGIGLILYISPRLTAVMLLVLPVIIIIAVLFGKRIRKLSRQTQDQLADSNIIVQETLQGIASVKAFSNEWFEMSRYGNSLRSVVQIAVRSGRLRGLFISFLIFSLFGTCILVVWYGITLMQAGRLSFGDLTAFVLYTSFVGGSMAGFADLYGQLQKTIGATQRVRELLREETEAIETDNLKIKPEFRLYGDVSIRQLSFYYPSRPEIEVLRGISLEAGRGEQIALVGPSRAGKTTITSLLLSFTNLNRVIFFDGRNVRDIPLSQLRKRMAVVPQDVLLFGGTIRENIAYGKPDATRAEVEAAARQANAHEFILDFPQGYETVVGERGVKLSGGQRQRIAIARAILKDPVILILDEATSSLDSASEALVQEALQNLMKDRTSFIVAHRLSTIRNADRIIVLDKGAFVESGTHQELLEIEGGLYRNLNKLQVEYSE